MKKINIYSPTYHREDIARQFVPSLLDSMSRSNYDVKAFIGDNNSPETMKNWLKSQSFDDLEVHLFDKNYGKGHVVNTMHNNARSADYVMTIDSDIICKNNDNWIDMYVDILESEPKIGIVSARFQEGVSHSYKNLNQTLKVNGYDLIHGSVLIGGACLTMSSEMWREIGGYTSKDLYAGDDGSLMYNCIRKRFKIAAVCMSTELYHLDDDPNFKIWKNDRFKKFRKKQWTLEPNTGYYENL